MKNRILLILLVIMLFSACREQDKLQATIAAIDMDVTVERFDKDFGSATVNNLKTIKDRYPFMFAKHYKDSFWLAWVKDTIQQELVREVALQYPKTDALEEDIERLFKHLKYYFPEFHKPRVVTTTSMVDYRNKVIVTDTIALIALDNYLGADHKFYQNIPQYLRANFKDTYIVTDLAEAYASNYVWQSKRKTLLDEMIYYGKQMYVKALLLPEQTEAQIMGYTQEQFNWAQQNEHYIWRYFVERELLFSTDTKLPARFINPAPFSKFYLAEIDGNSPGRIGQYIGWQIVKAYMNTNNEVTLKAMLSTAPKVIFDNSKFKPRK